jgi:hypothetical protein
MSAQSEDDSLSAFSSVDVWHPTSAQKSYGKERRYVYVFVYVYIAFTFQTPLYWSLSAGYR